jgi:hypothetical protein
MAAGSLVGALFAAWTGDRIGRRDSMFFACFTFIVGSTLMCGVQNRLMLVIARVINGFGAGILTSQGPIYIAEVSRPHLRGRLISLQQWMISWGVSLPASRTAAAKSDSLADPHHVFRLIRNILHPEPSVLPHTVGLAGRSSAHINCLPTAYASVTTLARQPGPMGGVPGGLGLAPRQW